MYVNGDYLEKNPTWHAKDSASGIPYYPLDVSDGQTLTLRVGIVNHEYAAATYQVRAEADGVVLFSSPTILLQRGQRWEGDLAIPMRGIHRNGSSLIEMFLLKDSSSDPYRRLHLWLGDGS